MLSAHQLTVVKNQPLHLSSVFFHIEFPKIDFVQNITFSWYYWKSMQRFDSRSGIFRFTRNRAKALDDSDVFCDYGTERLLTC